MQPDAWTDDSGLHGKSYCKPSSRGVSGRGPRLSVQITMVILGLIVLFRSTGVNGAPIWGFRRPQDEFGSPLVTQCLINTGLSAFGRLIFVE